MQCCKPLIVNFLSSFSNKPYRRPFSYKLQTALIKKGLQSKIIYSPKIDFKNPLFSFDKQLHYTKYIYNNSSCPILISEKSLLEYSLYDIPTFDEYYFFNASQEFRHLNVILYEGAIRQNSVKKLLKNLSLDYYTVNHNSIDDLSLNIKTICSLNDNLLKTESHDSFDY